LRDTLCVRFQFVERRADVCTRTGVGQRMAERTRRRCILDEQSPPRVIAIACMRNTECKRQYCCTT